MEIIYRHDLLSGNLADLLSAVTALPDKLSNIDSSTILISID
jgi:hypothetical protein